VKIFSRQKHWYELKATEKEFHRGEKVRIQRYFLGKLQNECLCPLSYDIAAKLGLPADKVVHAFKRDLVEEPELRISTVIVIIGNIHDDMKESIVSYSQMICLRAGVTNLVHHIKQDAQDVYDKVDFAYHTTKTPLQWIVDFHENIDSFSADALGNTREAVIEHALSVKEYLGFLQKSPDSPQLLDLSDLAIEMLADWKPTIQTKQIQIEWVSPPRRSMVHIDPVKLRVVLDNLLDNAFKYSFHKPLNAIRSIRLEMSHEEGCAILHIQNYGIGIKSDILKRLNEESEPYGVRGEVEDPIAFKRHEYRSGSGFGIAICKGILESNDGWLKLDSRPADSGYRSKVEEYHRYLTTVTIHLPLKEG
jgi:signal transduction histidine kinase